MAGNSEAMEDLKSILESRTPFYSKAQFKLDTSKQTLDATSKKLLNIVRQTLE
jgi:XRE family aerobic/anaerobic benzoate catabolism transcriptional regulator